MATQKIYSPQEAQAKLASLPPEVREYIYSQPMYDALKAISIKHKLHIDQLALLEAETSAVMMGFTESEDFVPMLQENLHLDAAQAQTVAQDVNAMVLEKVRGVMKTTAPSSSPTPASAAAPSAQVLPEPPQSRTILPTPKQLTTNNEQRITNNQQPIPKPPAPVIPPRPLQPAVQKPPIPAAPPPPKQLITNNEQRITNNQPPPKPPAPVTPRPAPTPVVPAPNPLRGVEEKLSAPTISAAKPFDLSLGGQKTPPPPAATEPTPPPKKNYSKDPYREPVE